MNSKKPIIIIVLLVAVLGIFFGYKKVVSNGLTPVDINDEKNIQIEIPEGSTPDKIAEILLENGIIRNKYIFKSTSKKEGRSAEFKAGTYSFSKSMDLNTIIDMIAKGEVYAGDTKFTIPEGFEIRQMAERLEEENGLDKEKFLAAAKASEKLKSKYSFLEELEEGTILEGYLYPDTYIFDPEQDNVEENIVDMMLQNFDVHFTEELENKAKNLGYTINEFITLASIIEREAQVSEERPIISAVFQNRIETEMKLESCATVQYILGERKPVLSNADVKKESPYNTYLNIGLPPTPIASPGIESIEAAANPKDVDYLFFVAKGDGGHVFSKTYAEHLEAQKQINN